MLLLSPVNALLHFDHAKALSTDDKFEIVLALWPRSLEQIRRCLLDGLLGLRE